MTIKTIIKDLQSRGYNISFYKRKDGGIRITRINGKTFRGSTGNIEARKITGTSLTEGQQRALSKLTTPRGKGNYNKRRRTPIDEETKKRIRKLQRLYRKTDKKEGKPTIRNYRYVLKTKGKEEADRLLRQSERRILGYAYTENVDALLIRISQNLAKDYSPNMEMAYNKILSMREAFPDRLIPEIYDLVYMWEEGAVDGDTTGDKILALLN